MKAMLRPAFAVVILAGLLGSADAQLLHRYDFAAGGSANDAVGTANGTIHGSATVSGGALNTTGAVGGLSGGAPQNSVGLPASAVAGITGAFSIEAWFSCSYNGAYCTLFSFSDGTTANYVLATPAAGYSPYPSRAAVKGGGGNAAEQLANQIYCDTGLMHDAIVTYDGTNVTYYLDGTLQSYAGLQNSFADPGLNLSTLTSIGVAGGSPFAADNTINGKVYDFRIYGQALTLNQVAGIYALGTNAITAAISNVLTAPPVFGVPFNGNLVRMPFYGSPYLHDPGTMRKDGGSYFIYGDGTGISGITSTDLRNWSAANPVFPNNPPAWTTNAVPGGSPNYFWAPDMAFFNGLWHMYYAYSQWGTINSVIGLATSPSLTNAVWTDRGKVVQSNFPATTNTDTTAYNCIDPSIYVAANGTVWLSYGSYSSGILVAQIDPTTGLRLNTNSVGTQVANNAVGGGWGSSEEGSCIYQHGGYWYLFVNWGGRCDLTYSTYNIRVGRGTSPTGPYYDKTGADLDASGGTMFLESSARYIGPGHAAICDDNGTNWFTYHFYDGLANGFPTVGMNQLYWSADGWPVMTNEWSAFYPLSADANESSGTYNGALQGGAGFTNDPVRGSVLNLNGTSGSVSLPLSVGNASTFAAWVKWNGGAAWQRIFDFGNDTNNYFFLTPAADTGDMRFSITTGRPGGEQQINAPYALPIGSWVHVAVTLDGSAGILYLDGAPVATNSALTIRPWQTTPHNNNLGKSQFAADPLFNGRMASFRIFGRALSAAEIKNLAWAHPALAHRYSFGTNALTAGWDSIGLAHGTLMGNAAVAGNALNLTGAAGGYMNLPGGLVSGSAATTIEFWATFGTNGNWAQVFDSGNMSGPNGQNFLFFAPHAPTNTQTLALTSPNLTLAGTLDNRTVHVACIVDPAGKYGAIYTNGVLESSGTVAWPALSTVGTQWSFLGRSMFLGEPYLNASVDELRIYDGRLTPQQIAADYQFGPDALAEPVSLSLTNLGGGLSLSWPSWAVGFAPLSSPDLSTWATNGASAVLTNDQWLMTLPGSNARNFYRLER